MPIFSFFDLWYVNLKILRTISIILEVYVKNKSGHCTSSFTRSGVIHSYTFKYFERHWNIIRYLEGYLDGCWMNALTILCMASV
jgi:hypothetical protein